MPRRLPRESLLLCCFLTLFSAAARASDSAGPLDLGALRGQVVVVDFWASWCAPCRRSFPWMNEMQDRYRDQGLVVIGVNVDSSWEEASRFLDAYPPGFRIVHDADGKLARQFELLAMPSTYVFDRNGTLLARHLGFRTRMTAAYETIIRDALAQAAAVSAASASR